MLEYLNLSATGLLFVVVAMLFVIGLVIEGLAALIIFVPVLMPLIPVFGLNEIHFALIMIVTILIGTVTPPVGLQLIAASIGRTPIEQVMIWPFVLVMMVVVSLMILFPPFVTWTPSLFMP